MSAIRDSARGGSKRDQQINEQRKKLQQLRLQTESENTKLLKIQQKEREVESQYQNQKKKMEETLKKLGIEQKKFESEQKRTTAEFESQKQQIFSNERKKEIYNKQKEDLQVRNEQRREQINQKQEKIKVKKAQLQDIRMSIKKYQVYEEFLKDVRNLSQDFGPSDTDQFSVMSILERFRTMEKKKIELAEVHKRIGIEKENRTKDIQDLRKTREQDNYKYTHKSKLLKGKIDQYNDNVIQLESQLEGQLNQNGERQRQIGQVIFSIRGLYLSIVGEDKQSKNTVQMLQTIREERRKLRQYLDLFQHKVEDAKKAAEKKETQ